MVFWIFLFCFLKCIFILLGKVRFFSDCLILFIWLLGSNLGNMFVLIFKILWFWLWLIIFVFWVGLKVIKLLIGIVSFLDGILSWLSWFRLCLFCEKWSWIFNFLLVLFGLYFVSMMLLVIMVIVCFSRDILVLYCVVFCLFIFKCYLIFGSGCEFLIFIKLLMLFMVFCNLVIVWFIFLRFSLVIFIFIGLFVVGLDFCLCIWILILGILVVFFFSIGIIFVVWGCCC